MIRRASLAVRASPAALAALLVALLVQLSPLLFLGRPVGVSDILTLYAPWQRPGQAPPANPLLDDAATGMHPWLAAFRRHPGELLATPSVACGAVGPLAGVFGLLSPAVVLPFFLLPRALAFTGMALFDLVLGFLAFYVWRRRRGDADLPAALGAAVWAWAPARAVYRTWPFFGLPILWPLLLLAVDAWLSPGRSEDRPARSLLVAAALTLGLVLGGHPSLGLLGLDLAALYALARAISSKRRGVALLPVGRRWLAPAGGAALALLALAPVLALGRAFLADGEWRELRAGIASAPPVPWRVLFLLFDPSFYGDPVAGTWRGLGWAGPDNLVELQLYLGLVPLLLVPLALALRPRREALFFTALGAALLLALLAGGPFAAAARLLPGAGIVFLSRTRLLLVFAAAVLVSLGAEALARSRLGRVPLLLPALLLFTSLDLSLADLRFDPFPPRPDAPPERTPAVETLARLAPGNGHRFLGFGTALVPNLAFEFELEDVRAHLLFTAGYRRFLSRLDPHVFGRRGTFLTLEPETFRPDPFVLDLLGVGALIAPPGGPSPGGDFVPAYRGPDADVYARAWAPPARLVGEDRADAEPTGRIVSFSAERTRWRLAVEAQGPSTLLLGRQRLSLVDRVRVDGRRTEPRTDARAEGLLAVDLPSGRHLVEVEPALPVPLLFASGAGLVGLALAAASATLLRT